MAGGEHTGGDPGIESATTVDRFNSPAHTEQKQISAQTAAAQRATPYADDDGNVRS